MTVCAVAESLRLTLPVPLFRSLLPSPVFGHLQHTKPFSLYCKQSKTKGGERWLTVLAVFPLRGQVPVVTGCEECKRHTHWQWEDLGEMEQGRQGTYVADRGCSSTRRCCSLTYACHHISIWHRTFLKRTLLKLNGRPWQNLRQHGLCLHIKNCTSSPGNVNIGLL